MALQTNSNSMNNAEIKFHNQFPWSNISTSYLVILWLRDARDFLYKILWTNFMEGLMEYLPSTKSNQNKTKQKTCTYFMGCTVYVLDQHVHVFQNQCLPTWKCIYVPSNLLYKTHQIPTLKCSSSRLEMALAQSIEKNEDIVWAASSGDAPTTSAWWASLLPTQVRLISGIWW